MMGNLGPIRSLMTAFRTACHYGDDAGYDSSTKFSTMSSRVFNKITVFVVNEMDGILRKLLKLQVMDFEKKGKINRGCTALLGTGGVLFPLSLFVKVSAFGLDLIAWMNASKAYTKHMIHIRVDLPTAYQHAFVFIRQLGMLLRDALNMKTKIEANSELTNKRSISITFLPNDSTAISFLEDEKKLGSSPLSKYVLTLRQRAQQRRDSLMECSLLSLRVIKMGKIPESDEEDDTRNEEGAVVFSSSWLPGSDSNAEPHKDTDKKWKKKRKLDEQELVGDDVVEDLVLSSDEVGSLGDSSSGEDDNAEQLGVRQQSKKQEPTNSSKKKVKCHAKKSKKRKRASR